jgi:hypothetical protein
VASVRANQIAQQVCAPGTLQASAELGCVAMVLTAEFHGVFCPSKLPIVEFL